MVHLAGLPDDAMGRRMTELCLTPASRSRIVALSDPPAEKVDRIEMVLVWRGEDGKTWERPMDGEGPAVPYNPDRKAIGTRELDDRV